MTAISVPEQIGRDKGIADVLFGDYPFTGKLPYTWPKSMAQVPLDALAAAADEPLFPFGYGLT